MFEEKKQNNSADHDEVEKLRTAILKWIDLKQHTSDETSVKHKKNLKKNKNRMPLASVLESKKTGQAVKSKHNKYRLIVVFGAVVILITVVAIGFGVGLYVFNWDNPTVRFITTIIPYPAAIVNTSLVPYGEWQTQVDSLSKYYQSVQRVNNEVAVPALSEIKRLVFDRLINSALINQAANKYDIAVTNDELQKQINNLSAEIGGFSILQSRIQSLYGWSIAKYQQEVVGPALLKSKLSIAIMLDDRINYAARAKIKALADELAKNPSLFELFSGQYSEDSTAVRGGDLGYFGMGEMVPEFEQAVAQLKPGQISGVVKTRFGYHLIRLDEKFTDQATGAIQYHAHHILIRGMNIDQYLTDLRVKSPIWQLVSL